MTEPARRRFSFREYLRLEEYSNVRHEFLDGVIYAMAGGTPEHAALAARIIQRLGTQLQGKPCEVFVGNRHGLPPVLEVAVEFGHHFPGPLRCLRMPPSDRARDRSWQF